MPATSRSRTHLHIMVALGVSISGTAQGADTVRELIARTTHAQAQAPAAAQAARTNASEQGVIAASECELPPAKDGAGGGQTFRDCTDTPELIALEAGRFQMGELGNLGTYYERPVHEVAVAAFALGKYEVTFDEWDACHRDGACQKNANDEGWGRGRRPVINVSWSDAQQYVRWLSSKTGHRYRLPSEAEWEYAARAGTTSRYSWGDSAEWACDVGNVFDSSGQTAHPEWNWSAPCDDRAAFTAPVGSYKSNPWGFHDMAGNVWEWVEDCWHKDYSEAPDDGHAWIEDGDGDCRKHVNRGGGWGNHPRSMRSATRDADPADAFSDAIGFRVARDL